jgi:hypothetical protein
MRSLRPAAAVPEFTRREVNRSRRVRTLSLDGRCPRSTTRLMGAIPNLWAEWPAAAVAGRFLHASQFRKCLLRELVREGSVNKFCQNLGNPKTGIIAGAVSR